MKAMNRAFTLLCVLAVVLVAALTPVAFGLLFAILIPLWFFVAAIFIAPVSSPNEHLHVPRFPNLPVFSPRPPPAR
jgi:hypothetical protein